MACELKAYIVDADDETIKVMHVFYGADEAECDELMSAHMADCKNFSRADADGRVITEVDTIDDDDVPDPDDFEEDEEEDEEEEEEET